jgi:hypothetical protein
VLQFTGEVSCHGSLAVLSGLGPNWLLAVSKTQTSVVKENRISDVEVIKCAKKNLTDIAVQDFKNCSEQRSKSREHCIELERDLKHYRLLKPAALNFFN